MPIVIPKKVTDCVADFDARPDTFDVIEVATAIEAASKPLSDEQRRGGWAEWAAFSFDVHPEKDGGPWKTYFQPMMSRVAGDKSYHSPDLRQADGDVIAYWSDRSRLAKHPILVARYADLVWDFTRFVTGGKPPVEFARRAIDAYVRAIDLDEGAAWGDNLYNLSRALSLAQSIRDENRVREVVRVTISYAERTAEEDKLGTYAYLFDNLLPSGNGPPLTPEQEAQILDRFERMYAKMATPGGPWDADPYSPKDVGERLAAYYARKGRADDAARAYSAIAAAFERRAKLGDALAGMLFLEEARNFHLRAGRRDEAERVQSESQHLAPAAEAGMQRITVKHEVSDADVEKYLEAMTEGGLERALSRVAVHFIPDQKKLADETARLAEQFPLYGMFAGAAKVMGDAHIEADVGDDAGDPDGRMVHETARHVQLHAPWIAWTIDRLIRDGMSVSDVLAFVAKSPLFGSDRLPLVQQALEAHIAGDYVKSIHALVPQIERALVRLPPLAAGKPSNKPHRSGRGLMQFKNLNDVLDAGAWPIKGELGENLRMYLLAVLAHPKGMNVRNDVCHGLWPAERFTKVASERLIQVLLAVAMLRPTFTAGAIGSASSDPPETPKDTVPST